jgi:hypothetical protein
MLYVTITEGTRSDFESGTCGAEIVRFKDAVYTDAAAEDITAACWVDTVGQCGPEQCPCPIPNSIIVTPVVFNMNMTHTESEGLIYFNNYFIPTFRKDQRCSFSRYLSTYADSKGFSVRLYIDQFKSTCTKNVVDEILTLSFKNYWFDALNRYNLSFFVAETHDGHDHDEESNPDSSTLKVAGITSYSIEEPITLDVDACWVPETDGLRCKAADPVCDIYCSLDAHCSTNDECGTGFCGKRTSDDHEHLISKNVTIFYSNHGINIDQVDPAQIKNSLVLFHHDGDQGDEDSPLVCVLEGSTTTPSSAPAFNAILTLFTVLVAALLW